MVEKIKRDNKLKTCRCHTCGRSFHPLGIARHRAMHRDKYEDCTITFKYGRTVTWKFSRNRNMSDEPAKKVESNA